MVGENNQKERKSNGKAGALERSSAFCTSRDETATKYAHEEAAPLLQDHWACLPTTSRKLFNFSSCPAFFFLHHQLANAFLIITIF